MGEVDARDAAERAARTSYGRLIAYLSVRTRDVAAAEDALGEAFRAALSSWPATGVPDNPEAWLLVAARRTLGKMARHRHVETAGEPRLTLAMEEAEDRMLTRADDAFPDERLKLLFVCAHPAIDAASHTPLMLQTVLGLDAARIAAAFVASPAAMAQRLVRAKAKIRDAGVSFAVPDRDALPARIEPVLDAIYAAYGAGWDAAGVDDKARGLAGEALWLARTMVALMPAEPEARGLLSLLLYCESRSAARRDPGGSYVPLDQQDVAGWDAGMIDEADGLLRQAGLADRFGRFQCEAAIQSVHAERRRTGVANWTALLTLYEALVRLAPALGAQVSRAAVLAKAKGPELGLAALDALDRELVAAYQPYWAVRADILARAGRLEESRAAYHVAAGLASDPAVKAFLLDRARRTTGLDG